MSKGGYNDDGRGNSQGTTGLFSGSYDRLVSRQPSTAGISRERKVDPLVDPKGRVFECRDTPDKNFTPIVIAFDVTLSRGNDLKIIFEKLPMILGQAIGKNYVDWPCLSFCAIGDATAGDKAPLQTGFFESDNRLDEILAHMWLEKGGGGTGQESYELAAYAYAHKSYLDVNEKRGEKGYFFFIGDEGFYPKVSKAHAKKYLGDNIPEDVDSIEVFRLLQEKYEVFFIYPKQSWEERKADIDAEIKTRIVEAGGQYDNVDLRASLSWNTFDDLDIHCICPDGGHIQFSNKTHGTGALDIDRNASGTNLTRKPVENIRWPKGKAPAGKYEFFVLNYDYHDEDFHRSSRKPVPFKVELENNGKIEVFEGVITEVKQQITAFEIDYDPNARPVDDLVYAGYDDGLIKSQWATAIPEDHILIIENPKAIADVILGALAVMNGFTLDAYIVHLGERGQTQLRQNEVAGSIGELSNSMALTTTVKSGGLITLDSMQPQTRRRGGGTTKI